VQELIPSTSQDLNQRSSLRVPVLLFLLLKAVHKVGHRNFLLAWRDSQGYTAGNE
jgi:hypothetical protein